MRDSISVEDAGAIIWTLASPETHRALTIDCGWPSARYRDWLQLMLTASLLP